MASEKAQLTDNIQKQLGKSNWKAAIADMEKLFGGKIHLEVWVKVRSGWTDDARALKRLGYE